ncbi:hypothetical protein ENKOMM052M1_03970 [Enterobacter kobei]
MKTCSIQSFSATKQAPLPAPRSAIRDGLSAPTAVRCFLMNSPPRPCWCRKNCCASLSMANWSASAVASRCRLTCVWCAPPTPICRRGSRRRNSEPICSTAWPLTLFSFPPCASEEVTLCCSQTSLRFRCAASSACLCSPASAIMQRRRYWPITGREIFAN